MPRLTLLCEYATLNGGEQSMLATLDGVRRLGFTPRAIAPPEGPLADALRCRDVELLPLEVGSIAEFGEVLAIADAGDVNFGTPNVAGARVLAEVQSHYKDKKLIVFKYKRKTRYRRKKGHRQNYTRIQVQDIQAGG